MRHLNYKSAASEMRDKGIHKVFRAREEQLKEAFMSKTLTEDELAFINNKNSDAVEVNKIRANALKKFKILKQYLFEVVSNCVDTITSVWSHTYDVE